MHEDVKEILYTAEDLQTRVNELGEQITKDYKPLLDNGDELVVLCILKGAVPFAADLARQIKLPIEMDFMAISSYGNSAKSSGMIRLQKDVSCEIENKHVLIIEDIVDTGLTLSYLNKALASRNPKSIKVVSLLSKQLGEAKKVEPDYVGFECPNEFIVGYGLDYAQRYRNLCEICILKPEVYS